MKNIENTYCRVRSPFYSQFVEMLNDKAGEKIADGARTLAKYRWTYEVAIIDGELTSATCGPFFGEKYNLTEFAGTVPNESSKRKEGSAPVFYIAGPMTGLPNFNRESFHAMADHIRAEGVPVLNPAELPSGLTQSQYMDICLAMLRCATHIVMLEGWQNSEGAKIERALAIKSGLTVEYENTDELKAVSNGKL